VTGNNHYLLWCFSSQ